MSENKVIRKILGSIYLSIYQSMALQPFVGPWPLFNFLSPIHSRYDFLDG
jgi:hypothetical protein